ncbi:UNVERIFIED_CONTAM: phosphatidylinositol 3- and 4-kinase [Hammondia hammondi]|eukprot:XP_008886845.1 phosphatidylinositol 3- and 4-kinase [Hammondia hammondi]
MASLSSPTATERVMLASSSPFPPVLSPETPNQACCSPALAGSRQPASASLPCTSPETSAAGSPPAPNSTLSGSPLSGTSSSHPSILDDEAAGVLEATAAFVASPDSEDAVRSEPTSASQCLHQASLKPVSASAARPLEQITDSVSTRDSRPDGGKSVAGIASLSADDNMEGSDASETYRDCAVTAWKREAECEPSPAQKERPAAYASRERGETCSLSEESATPSAPSPLHSSSTQQGSSNASEMSPLQDMPSPPASTGGLEAPSVAGLDGIAGPLEQQPASGKSLAFSERTMGKAEEIALGEACSKEGRLPGLSSPSSSALGSFASLARVSSSSSSSLGRRGDEGSLLRLFQSEYFDAYFHMYYLFHRQEAGVHEYLVNLLYVKRTDEDIIFYLPQLVQLSLVRFKTSSLHRFLLDKASKSMHLALMASWLYQSMVEDKVAGLEEPAQKMTQEVEMAVVNSKPLGAGTHQSGWNPSVETEEQGQRGREERGRNSENAFAIDLFKRRRIVQLIRQHQQALRESRSPQVASRTSASLPPQSVLSGAPDKAQREPTVSSRNACSGSCAVASPQSSSAASDSIGGSNLRAEREPSPSVTDQEATSSFYLDASRRFATSSPSVSSAAATSAACASRGSLRRPTVSAGALVPRIPQSLRHLTGPTTVAGAKVKLPSVYGKLGNPLSLSTLQLLPFSTSGARAVREEARSGKRCEGTTENSGDAAGRSRGEAPADGEGQRTGQSVAQAEGRGYRGERGGSDWASDGREMEEELQQFIMKQRRCDYFNTLNHFISLLIDVSNALALEPDRSLRPPLLSLFLESLNSWILCRRLYVTAMVGTWTMTGVTIPFHEVGFDPNESESVLHRRPPRPRSPHASFFTPAAPGGSVGSSASHGSSRKKPFAAREEERGPSGVAVAGATGTTRDDQIHSLQILRIDVKECRALSSKKRVPYLLVFEVADLDEDLTQFEDCQFGATAAAADTVSLSADGSPVEFKTAFAGCPSGHASPRAQSPFNLSHVSSRQSPGARGGRRDAEGRDDSRKSQLARRGARDREGERAGTGGELVDDDAPALDWSSLYVYQAIVEELKHQKLYEPGPSSEDSVTVIRRALSLVPPDPPSSADATPSNSVTVFSIPGTKPPSSSTQPSNGSAVSLGSSVDNKVSSSQSSLSSSLSSSPSSTLSALSSSASSVPQTASSAAPSAPSEPSSSRGFFAGLESFSFSSSFSSSSPVASSLGASLGLLQAGGLGAASTPSHPVATADTEDHQRHDGGTKKGDDEEQHRVESEHAQETAEGTTVWRAKQKKPLWGELWADKRERLRRRSPYGHLRSWDIRCVLVKGGDDLRQELLASQLVRQFKAIFDEARLPLWLRPYEILVTGSNSGVMEFVPDTCSVDVLKKRHNTDSIARVFDVLFADNPFEAKKNFIESHAAYSLVSYFLQVKDRHNGNLLLDAEGHLIHIDYGYLLSNSPGNINFETSPFKLTQEFLDVMDGETSDNYEYFRTLIIRGFLEARKHADRIILLVEMMLSATKMPCFSGGQQYTLDALRERFMIGLPEDTCIERIVDLIETSVNNFRTVQYDNFQRITNGIL